jgi:hypothetical protein
MLVFGPAQCSTFSRSMPCCTYLALESACSDRVVCRVPGNTGSGHSGNRYETATVAQRAASDARRDGVRGGCAAWCRRTIAGRWFGFVPCPGCSASILRSRFWPIWA